MFNSQIQADMSSTMQPRLYVQRGNDRRVSEDTAQLPLLDSEYKYVSEDRRQIPHRRKSIQNQCWTENQAIRHKRGLYLDINGKSNYFDSTLEKLCIGRSLICDVQLNNRFVSKKHAYIRYQNGNYILQDESLNGTFVEIVGNGRIHLQGQELCLAGSGKICFGAPVGAEKQQTIYFYCI